MSAVARFLIKYLGIPLAMRLLQSIVQWISKEAELQKLRLENKELKENLVKAQTPKEREDATADLARRFNRD
jgi:cell division protein FtsB